MRITLLKLIAVAQPSDSTSLELGLNPRVDFSNKFPDRCCYCCWFTLQTIGLNIDYSEFPGANGDWLKENTTLHCEVLLNSHQENRHWSITERPSKTGATWIAHPGFCQVLVSEGTLWLGTWPSHSTNWQIPEMTAEFCMNPKSFKPLQWKHFTYNLWVPFERIFANIRNSWFRRQTRRQQACTCAENTIFRCVRSGSLSPSLRLSKNLFLCNYMFGFSIVINSLIKVDVYLFQSCFF